MHPHRDDKAKDLRDEAAQKLILDYQNGDRKAFNRLLDEYKYWKYIFKALCAKGIPSTDAEDYTQQICIRLTKGLKKFRFGCSFKSYLNLIIRNQLINHYRRRRKLENGVEFKLQYLSIDEPVSTDESEKPLVEQLTNPNASLPDADLLFQELRRIIGACLHLFKNKTVKLIICLWLYGMKQRQIAALLQFSMGTVGSNLHRGQKRLRYCVKKRYFKT